MKGNGSEYWGVRQIAERMNCSPDHVYRLWEDYGFLMYKIPFRGPTYVNRPPNERWYTNDGLIRQWELMQVYNQRQAWKRKPKGVPLEVLKHGNPTQT